jgi:hypothetical protein
MAEIAPEHKNHSHYVALQLLYQLVVAPQMLPEANAAAKALLNEVGLYFQLISATAFTLTMATPTNKAIFNQAAADIFADILTKVR